MKLCNIRGAFFLLVLATAPAAAQERVVDLELALLIDRSGSISAAEFATEVEGYATGVESQRVVNAILSGPIGSIAVMVATFADPGDYDVLVPWVIVASAEDAAGLAALIRANAGLAGGGNTAIGAAVMSTIPLFEANPYEGLRLVIDVVADGSNNLGISAHAAREAAAAAGVTINGLAIADPTLDRWMREDLITGPGSFAVAVAGFEDFDAAIEAKLVNEIAYVPASRPVYAANPAGGDQP